MRLLTLTLTLTQMEVKNKQQVRERKQKADKEGKEGAAKSQELNEKRATDEAKMAMERRKKFERKV